MLVVLRGNSGSGKSTVARGLQARLRAGAPTAILAQDVFRRQIYREKEQEGLDHAELLEVAARHCLARGHHVIVEGILDARLYGPYLGRIAAAAVDARPYAFDLTFGETLRRHAGRRQAAEFGEESMRRWYHGWHPLGTAVERRIGPEEGVEEIIERILADR